MSPAPEGPYASERPADAQGSGDRSRLASSGIAGGWAATGAVLAGLAVAAGAFGAHALEPHLTPARMGTFQTAVRYQMFHALALLIVATMPRPVRAAAPLLAAGSVIFAGSLYALVASDVGLWGAVAPIGGALMIAGWALAAWRLARAGRS